MIGIIPHVVDAYMLEKHGNGGGVALRERVALPSDHIFRLDADYRDGLCRASVAAATVLDGGDLGRFRQHFADFFLAWSLDRFSGLLDGVTSARQFLLRQPMIHNWLAAGLLPAQRCASRDKFVTEPTATGLPMTYRSPNRLGVLCAALVAKVAERYGERAELTVMDGAPDGPFCRFEVMLKPFGVVARKEAACAG